MLPDLGCKNALILQGPAGPFFSRFATELRSLDVKVTKVNFHAGDALFFSGPDALPFRGKREDWPAFVGQLMSERNIDAVFLFGDCRPLHRMAIEVANDLGIDVWVFEEGYLRPDYITLERGGVNGNSSLPRDPSFYLTHRPADHPETANHPRGSFLPIAVYSAANALAFTLLGSRFPNYEHHRPLNAWSHTYWWCKAAVRKRYFQARERGLLEVITRELSGRYFFVPLQVHCDFQLVHSPYEDLLDFVAEVVREFALHARSDDALVFKHHPMDRAYREYGDLFKRLAREHELTGRLYYVHDLHLPSLLKHARGTITINSTVGISSMYHRTPVMAMGTAVYDMPGLTFQGELRDFLRDPGSVDSELYEAFRGWLEHENQANGNFYRRLPGHHVGTGVRWFKGTGAGDP